MDGVEYHMDKDGLVAFMVEIPCITSSAKIVDIQIAGTAVIATVKEEGFWGTNSFTNFFILAILDWRRQITCGSHA